MEPFDEIGALFDEWREAESDEQLDTATNDALDNLSFWYGG